MKQIPEQLLLKEYVFDTVEFRTNIDHDPNSTEDTLTLGMTLRTQNFIHKKNPAVFQAKLEIEIERDGSSPPPYSGTLSVRGVFEILDAEIDEQRRHTFMNNLAPSLLYGAAREFIITVTSRMPFGQMMLPLTVFPLSPKNGDHERIDAESDEQGNSPSGSDKMKPRPKRVRRKMI